jgi:hypothetical protein
VNVIDYHFCFRLSISCRACAVDTITNSFLQNLLLIEIMIDIMDDAVQSVLFDLIWIFCCDLKSVWTSSKASMRYRYARLNVLCATFC